MCKPEKIVSLCTFIGIIIGMNILMIVSLINFVMGLIYRNQCPVEYWIWLYNIVAGSVGVFMIINYILGAILSQICSKRVGWGFFFLGFLILTVDLIWVIVSLTKIVPLWTQGIVQYTNPAVNTYCDPIFYRTTRVILVISAVCIGLIGGNAGIIALIVFRT